MYKYLVLLPRKDGLRHEEFAQYWQQEHAAIARTIEGSVRYHQVLPTDPETAEFDGIAEVYFETLEDLRAAFGGPDAEPDPDLVSAKEARHDTANFLDIRQIQQFAGEEVVQKDEVDGDTHGLYKHSAFLVRKDGMSHEDFREYWEHEHTPLARDIEGVVRYTTVYPAKPAAAPFDGVAEQYFDSLDDLQDALGSPGSRDYDPTKEIAAQAREDVDNFLAVEDRPRLIGQEHVVKDET
jgi:uncharacterized protein (TIGR02118 family)